MVPGLNDMYEKYAEQGLVIVGVTNESASLVDGSIASTKSTYPIGMTKGGAADAAYGVRGFPTVVLVGPDGIVLSKKRHPEAEIVEALKRVVLIQPLEGKQFASINKQLEKKQLGKALKSIESMLIRSPGDAQLTATKESIEKDFGTRLRAADAMAEQGSYATSVESFEKMLTLYNGYSRTSDVKARVRAIKKDPKAKDDLAAYAKLKTAKKEFAKGKTANRKNGLKICDQIISKYPHTPTADKARQLKSSGQ